MNYLAKFNETGKAIAFYCESVNFETAAEKADLIKNGCIEISETDYAKLLGNAGQGDNGTGYIYDSKTGAVISAPAAPAPTAEEIKAKKIADLDSQYKTVFEALTNQLNVAILANDTAQQDSIRAQYNDAKTQYAKALQEVG